MNIEDTSLWELDLYFRYILPRKPSSSAIGQHSASSIKSHSKLSLERHSELYKFYMAYVLDHTNIIDQNRKQYTDIFVYRRRLIERFIKLIHGLEAPLSLRRMSSAFYNNTNMNYMSMLTRSEQNQIFHGSVKHYEWHYDFHAIFC